MPARILVVDDEPNLVDLIRTTLERQGYEVIEASDGVGRLLRCAPSCPISLSSTS